MTVDKKDRSEEHRKYRERHPDKIKAAKKRYKKAHHDKVLAEKKRYRQNHSDKCSAYMKQYNMKTRIEVLTHYSGGTLKCKNCGESHIEFLEIDHINGNGKQHKREIRCTGVSVFRWLKINNYPEGYQVLCSNCNNKKERDAAKIRGTTGTIDQRKYYTKALKKKMDVFSHYKTDGKIKCSCPGCKVSDIDILCMDHINNDGAEHRKSLGENYPMLDWIRKNNYPPDFRILCHNCNQSLGLRGYCPHENNFSILKFLKI